MSTDEPSIIVETVDRVGLIRLNRPEARNAINRDMTDQVIAAAFAFDADPAIGAIIVTGSATVFAAGADVKQMALWFDADIAADNWLLPWTRLPELSKPIIAVVSGLALGGGCELAMMCDFIIASDTARFGQPEIHLGLIPGMGGTQRLTRLVGRSKAMELCLTGRMIDAVEAERIGLVTRVVPVASLMDEAISTAQQIAGMPQTVVSRLKSLINRDDQTHLLEDLTAERLAFESLFDCQDAREGVRAFLEKRPPNFRAR